MTGPSTHDHGHGHQHVHEHSHGDGREHGHEGDHGHDHSHSHAGAPKRALALALTLTLGFMGVEFGFGLYSGSLALLADAGHMLADAGALGLALTAQHWASKARTARSTFGFRRAEVLAAFVNGVLLAVTALVIVKEAVERWVQPVAVDAFWVLITASVGLGVNLAAAWILMRAGTHSVNVRAAFAHVLSDALGSVAAMIAGASVLWFGAFRIDPVVACLIALLVAVSGWRLLRETTSILLETAPGHLDVAQIENTIRGCPGVADLHDLHVWRISDRFDALTVHVTLDKGSHGVEVCRTVTERLAREHHLSHTTVQPEAPPPDSVVPVRRSRHGAPLAKRDA